MNCDAWLDVSKCISNAQKNGYSVTVKVGNCVAMISTNIPPITIV